MSIERCPIHDETYDTDFVEGCRSCRNLHFHSDACARECVWQCECPNDEIETLVSEHEATWLAAAKEAEVQS